MQAIRSYKVSVCIEENIARYDGTKLIKFAGTNIANGNLMSTYCGNGQCHSQIHNTFSCGFRAIGTVWDTAVAHTAVTYIYGKIAKLCFKSL